MKLLIYFISYCPRWLVCWDWKVITRYGEQCHLYRNFCRIKIWENRKKKIWVSIIHGNTQLDPTVDDLKLMIYYVIHCRVGLIYIVNFFFLWFPLLTLTDSFSSKKYSTQASPTHWKVSGTSKPFFIENYTEIEILQLMEEEGVEAGEDFFWHCVYLLISATHNEK